MAQPLKRMIDPAFPNDTIEVVRREVIATIGLTQFGHEPAVQAAFTAMGEYLYLHGDDNDDPLHLTFEYAGRTFYAGFDPRSTLAEVESR